MYIKEIEAATILNTDLQTISHWANDWLVRVLFNANKTLSMIFSRKPTVLPAMSDSDVMFCLQTYHGIIIDRLLVY